jgi:anti-anti-sigma factor
VSTSSAASSLITLSENRHRLLVTVRRESSTADWSLLEESGRTVIEQISTRKNRCVLLDLSEVDYLGSSSIAFLMRIWKHINQLDGRMVVVISDPKVYEIIRLSGLVKIWTIFDNVKAAERQLREERQIGRNIGPMLFLMGLLALVVSGGLFALQWFTDGESSRTQLVSQLSLGALAAILLLWATRIFTSGFRWVTLTAAAIACGLCAHSAYAIFGPPRAAVANNPPAKTAEGSSEKSADKSAGREPDSSKEAVTERPQGADAEAPAPASQNTPVEPTTKPSGEE